MTPRYICIHAHFYQPPRENPGLEAIEMQDSAYPYHDWNERITAECYAPNANSRILDGEGRIIKIVNNYAKLSFNFGPTLMAWLEPQSPEVYRAILAADQESQERFSGHGSALAQAYNHMILPLANRRDKETQVIWGIRDFQARFGRPPEGMWLPETAVDLETLGILVEQGIRFTILAPTQARRVRPPGGRWRDVRGGRVDPSMPYQLHLGAGRSIHLFFYDGPISRGVAFENLLIQGEHLAHRLTEGFDESRSWPQLVHIATDGETYGHHHRRGEMALSYALEYIESNNLAKSTNYGEYLERHPPTYEVEIFENSSWSCSHGVERWRSSCGCDSGTHPGWHQRWRGPLREALDWLRDALAPFYDQQAGKLLRDSWAARNDYIEVILDRSPESVERFFERHATRAMSEEEQVEALKLLELERQAMLMYTSCGWFFDDLSGLETVQVLQYAGRALQLAGDLSDEPLEARFLDLLERAKSNLHEHRDGRRIYEKWVKPSLVDLHKVGVHYAVSSMFESPDKAAQTYCYDIDREDLRLQTAGKAKFALGRAKLVSRITRESARMTFGVLHLGDHNVRAQVRQFRGEQDYQELANEVTEAFEAGDSPELLRIVGKHFESSAHTLKLLFRDEQRKILQLILESVLAETETAYRRIYQDHTALMRFLTSLGMPQPHRFEIAAEFTLNADLRQAMESDSLDRERIYALLDEATKAGVELDEATLEFAIRRKIERLTSRFREQPADLNHLQALDLAVELAGSMPFEVNLWTAQNDYYETMQDLYPDFLAKGDHGDETAQAWVNQFRALGEKLRVRVDAGTNG